MTNEAEMKLPRQPEPVLVTFLGNDIDVRYWMQTLASRAEFKGDLVHRIDQYSFKIYPRAVND